MTTIVTSRQAQADAKWKRTRCVVPGTLLTEREREVLDLVSRGHSNGQIGKQLYITENSVKTALRSAFVRLGARDRAHAVRLCFTLGYLTADEPPATS